MSGPARGERGAPDAIDVRLRAALRDAMKARDTVAVAAIRSALASIDNAGAVDIDGASPPTAPATRSDIEAATGSWAAHRSIAGAVPGLGAGEMPRRELGAATRISLVEAEVATRREAALEYDGIGRSEEAARLRAEADVLAGILR